MTVVLLRVWLPDRPGALGAVTSRVGSVGGDVVGIDILERGAGRAIDELWVDLEEVDLIDLLVSEVGEVDGVDVESCRPVDTPPLHLGLEALDLLEPLCAETDPAAIVAVLTAGVRRLLGADAVVVVDTSDGSTVWEDAVHRTEWLAAYALGTGAVGPAGRPAESPDVVSTLVGEGPLVLAVSRRGVVLRDKERRMVERLARFTGWRLGSVGGPGS